jgi:hypothetical protein
MDLNEAADMCICAACPTYFDCSEPLAFCLYAEGKSSCISVERGCICPTCPVQTAEGFVHSLYCTRGSAKTMGGSGGA